MLARSITKCYHRPFFTTPAHLPALRVPVEPRGHVSFNHRLQSTSASPLPPLQEGRNASNHDEGGRPDPSTITLPPQPPNPTALHHDLPTFLAHARRTGLSPNSTTYIGTHYEYTVACTLRRFAFDLKRTGGRGDAGIDLLGTWHLPSKLAPEPIRVLVQCKALKAKLGPNLIRELEGAFVGAPGGWRPLEAGRARARGVLGMLVSPREATKGVREAMGRSRWPMVWVMLQVVQRQRGGEDGAGGGEETVRQVLWNKAAGDVGLEGLDVIIKYDQAAEAATGIGKECVLMWQGRPVPGLDEQQVVKT